MTTKRARDAGQTALLSNDIRSDNYSTDQTSSINNDREPKDNRNFIYWISMLLGCGILIAYNFLISAPDYFDNQYPNYQVMNYIVPAYTIPDVIFLILSLFYGHLLSFTSRICISFFAMGIILFFPILTQYTFHSEDINFYIILGVSGFTGLTTAILQTSIIGFCNYLPSNYIRVSIAGQSVAGIGAGVIRIIINLIEDYTSLTSKTNGMIYFGIGGLFDILCCILFLYTIRNAFVKFHLTEYFWTRKYRGNIIKNENISQDLLQRTDTTTLLRKLQDDNIPTPRKEDFETVSQSNKQIIKSENRNSKKKMRKRTEKEKKLAKSMERQQNTYLKFRKDTHNDSDYSDNESESNMTTDDECDVKTVEITHTNSNTNQYSLLNDISAKNENNLYMNDNINENESKTNKLIMPKLIEKTNVISNGMNEREQEDKVTYCGVFKKIKLLVVALFLVFFVTFVVFPAMVVSIDSEYKWIRDNQWMSVFLVLEFNVCDYIGRQFFAAYTACSFSKRTLWVGCLWRMLIIPLFILLNTGVLKHDWIAYLSTGILGITNGHFCCLCFMWAPTMVNSNEQEMCGSIMSFALVMGITLGSYTTLLYYRVMDIHY